MNTNLFSLVTVITLSISLSGCMMMGMMKKKDDDGGSKMAMMKCGGMMMGGMGGGSHDDSNHDMSMEKDPEAYKITKRYCTQCHYLKEKNTHSGSDWNPTLMRMYTYMQSQDLMVPSEDEEEMIAKYYGVSN